MPAVQSILFAGVCAGMLGAGIGTPVDVVKTRIQAKGSAYTEGAVAAARQILREEGTPNSNSESSLLLCPEQRRERDSWRWYPVAGLSAAFC